MEKLNNTKPLKLLLAAFEQTENAIPFAVLLEELKDKMNRTTVYRIVQRLENKGILHSFKGKDGLKWYAKGAQHSPQQSLESHPHFQCKECGKVECMPLEVPQPSLPDYQINSVEILLIGLCKDCLSQ
ncbi:MAG: transcriptional repressor [Bacteroidota bacterium]